jgi:hypothetical protein
MNVPGGATWANRVNRKPREQRFRRANEIVPPEHEDWRAAEREKVRQYLDENKPGHGRVFPQPGWSLPPHAAIWDIDHPTEPETYEGWVISGQDLPTDFCPAGDVWNPRLAMQHFAAAWRDGPMDWTSHTDRLRKWAEDDSLWWTPVSPLGWRAWIPLASLVGPLLGFFIWGSVFHLFGRPIDLRAHPVTELGFFGWLILPFFTVGYAARGLKGGFVVAGVVVALFCAAYLVGLARGAYG